MSNPYQSSRPDESHMPPRQPPKPTDASEYLCGDCGAKTQIKMGELIRCRECGHRVMYKPRTHKISAGSGTVQELWVLPRVLKFLVSIVQFEAR